MAKNSRSAWPTVSLTARLRTRIFSTPSAATQRQKAMWSVVGGSTPLPTLCATRPPRLNAAARSTK
eukprot:9529734-Alexandrium_andersonii.AAC.1